MPAAILLGSVEYRRVGERRMDLGMALIEPANTGVVSREALGGASEGCLPIVVAICPSAGMGTGLGMTGVVRPSGVSGLMRATRAGRRGGVEEAAHRRPMAEGTRGGSAGMRLFPRPPRRLSRSCVLRERASEAAVGLSGLERRPNDEGVAPAPTIGFTPGRVRGVAPHFLKLGVRTTGDA